MAVGAWLRGPGLGLGFSGDVPSLLPSLDALRPSHECHHYASGAGAGVLRRDLADWLMDAPTEQGPTAARLGQHHTDLSR